MAEWGTPLCDVAKTALRIRFSPFGANERVDPSETERRRDVHDAYLHHYLLGYHAATNASREDASASLQRWLPIAAAARLTEGARAEERAWLLMLIECALAGAGPVPATVTPYDCPIQHPTL